ncbi:shikimate dehydrogenase [Lampropedia puyangensis]|uniref:Shikimate dehydrogenase (NADP(+)) n=1 Tax=Lampropedia puyangensis TaxID=1330072 RepID=A0A4S8EP65_9BURK|nr:shikimate dehydrogenase [Lampropedia puyangensis]THT96457.1 shikimate dehydrogenase [Lampropedia puyangensis]
MSVQSDHSLASPDRYVVIGNPIAHSRSPAIHQQFATLTGQRLDYGLCLSPVDAFATTLQQLRAQGIQGANVTVPFKLEAAQLATWADPRVSLAQAANTLVFTPEGEFHAYNTDGLGLVRDITVNAQTPLANADVLLLGAGGAAAGALAPLIEQQPALIAVANRTAAKAQALIEQHTSIAQQYGVQLMALALDEIDTAALPSINVLINATASSLQGATLPITQPARILSKHALVYDMMYGPAAQPFLNWASSHCPHAHLRDGLGMLVEQAAEAFAIWRGIRPPSASVLQSLRHEVDYQRASHA